MTYMIKNLNFIIKMNIYQDITGHCLQDGIIFE